MTAFATGVFLVSAYLDADRPGPVVTSSRDQGRLEAPAIRTEPQRPAKPERQVALPTPREAPAVSPVPPEAPRPLPMARSLTRLVAFEASPFPYDGLMPRTRS